MFSATFPQESLEAIQNLNRKMEKIKMKEDLVCYENLTHYYVNCSRKNKLSFMDKFLRKY